MKMIKIQSWITWVFSYGAAAAVYADKLLNLNLWYLDNFIKIYFVFCVLGALLMFGGFIGVIIMSKSLDVISNAVLDNKKNEYHEYLKHVNNASRPIQRFFQVLSFVIDIGYGVIGCWWFFAINIISDIFLFLMAQASKNVVNKIHRIWPEIKTQTEVDEKTTVSKFKYVMSR